MADVASDLKTWSTTESSNGPAGTTSIGTGLDDNLRMIQTVVRQDLAFVGSDIASASTTDLGAVKGSYHNITGTTTITSFGTVSAGISKWLKFAAALTLTHNSTSLILPTGANITTAAGDTCKAVSLGSGNWIVTTYSRATGRPLANPSGMVDTSSTQTLTSKTLTSPVISGSPTISGATVTTSTLTSPVINTSITGTALSTQSEMESGPDGISNKIMPPSMMRFHPGFPKAWGVFVGGTAVAQYGCALSKGSTGIYTFTFTTAFSSTSYLALPYGDPTVGTTNTDARHIQIHSLGTTSCELRTSLSGALEDWGYVACVFWGDN